MIRDRLLERLGLRAEPELVERASRRDRWKRGAWTVFSTWLGFSAAVGLLAIVDAATGLWSWLLAAPGLASLAPLLCVLALGLFLDIRLWAWGIERWDLVAPWQIREEWAREDQEVGES